MTSPARLRRFHPTRDDSRKEEFPFYWLARTHGRYILALEKALKKIDLDIPRYRILYILKDQGRSSISEIAEHAVVKMPTITKTIYRMKKDGLLETRPGRTDGRVTEVSITPEGMEAITRIEAATARLYTRSFKGMTETQLRRLNTLLETLFHNLPEH